jgi:HlyD family secretion protein
MRLFGLLLVGALGIGTPLALTRNWQPPEPPPPPRPLPAIAAWGRLIPSSDVVELAPVSAMDGVRVEKLLVEEGDEIRAGQVLAVLDLEARRGLAVSEARARLALAEARVAQTGFGPKPEEIRAQEALVRRNEVDCARAEREFERSKTLAGQRATTREETENRESTRDSARFALEQSRAQLESLKRIRDVDLAVARAERDQASAALEVTRAEHEATKIKAPFDGRVLKVRVRAGQRVADKGVVAVGDTRVMHVIAEVFEQDAPRVLPGARAEVHVPSLQLKLMGTVLRGGQMIERKDVFGNDPVADVDSRVIEVRIALDADVSRKVDRLTNARVEVRIELPASSSATEPMSAGESAERRS